ncbi:hypothetical protein B0H13DRAFT_2670578, partial [Mycena leptocephala]
MFGATRLPRLRLQSYGSKIKRVFSRCALNPSFARNASRRAPRPNSTLFSRSMSRIELDPALLLSLLRRDPEEFDESRFKLTAQCSKDSDQASHLNQTTLEELTKFAENIDPTSPTDDDLTFLLQYLKASDIPSFIAPRGSHILGLSHASVALTSIARILTFNSPVDRCPVQRVVQTWPDIEKWLLYTAMQWITPGKVFGPGKDMVDGFNAVIPFLSVVATVPDLRDVVLTEPNREQIFTLIILCWSIETSESTLIANDSKPKPAASLDFFRVVVGLRMQFGADYDPPNISQTALTLLRNHPPSLDLSNAHMQMLNLLGVAIPYSDALLAQHSIRDVTRLLSDLTSKPHDSASGPKMVEFVTSCVQYLTKFIPTKDGFCNARMALQAGILPAIIRCSSWVSEDTAAHEELMKALHIISLYLIYPSVLRPFLASVRKIEKLDIVDETKPLCASYLKL